MPSRFFTRSSSRLKLDNWLDPEIGRGWPGVPGVPEARRFALLDPNDAVRLWVLRLANGDPKEDLLSGNRPESGAGLLEGVIDLGVRALPGVSVIEANQSSSLIALSDVS